VLNRPRIVVLDGHTLNPGDLDWQPIAEQGEFTVYDRSDDEVVARARDASIVLTNKQLLNDERLAQLPKLRYIGVLATGVNVVDLEAARRRNILVKNILGYAALSMAQHVFALLLELAVHTDAHDRAVHGGQWSIQQDFCFTVAPITELADKMMGIVGVGEIGRRVAKIAAAMGMNVAAAHQRSERETDLPGVEIDWMSIDELFERADVITLHCPLTEKTRHLVNTERLQRMKPIAWLINTGRGDLVDESALAYALHEKRIAGAGLDVLSREPPPPDNPLLAAPNCVITPHCAWASIEARRRVMRIAAENIRAFLHGAPVNVVS